MSDDKLRVRHSMRRDGANLYVDIYFDDCKLERLIVGGDETIARMVESGELRLTANSKLVYEDGTPYVFPKRLDKIAKYMTF
jgi:hypothetical protein